MEYVGVLGEFHNNIKMRIPFLPPDLTLYMV